MKKLILISIVTLLVGCASVGPKVCKPGGSQAEFERDQYDCEMKTRTGHPAMILIDMEQQQKCMRLEKGWSICPK